MYAVELFEKRIFIRNSRINAAQLDTHLRKVIDDKGNVGIVFIDYLQDMKPDKRTGEHHADIEQMMINVDKLASDYGVAIIIPAQYRSKDDKKKWHKEDIIGEHRIAGSSSLSKKADVIYSLFNTTVHDYQSNEIDKIGDTQEIEIDIIKTRKQSYAKNLTFQFNRRTGMIEESTKVIMPKVATK
jgi:replicative DNA helicase